MGHNYTFGLQLTSGLLRETTRIGEPALDLGVALDALLLVRLRGHPTLHAIVRVLRVVPLDPDRLDRLGIFLALVGKVVDARDLLGEDLALVQRVFWGGGGAAGVGSDKMGFRTCTERARAIMATAICER